MVDPPGSGPDPGGPGDTGSCPGTLTAYSSNDPGATGHAAFHLLSRWELNCSRKRIWDCLVDFHTWPTWWPGLDHVIETIQGGSDGLGQRATSSWHGPLGYSLRIEIESVELLYPEYLRGRASGDVLGEGSWRLQDAGDGWSSIIFDWNVRSNRRWIDLLAPIARPVFIHGHDRVMKRGATGLAERLDCDFRDFSAEAV